jgi:transcriptional regulator with XRE-family HTH domain
MNVGDRLRELRLEKGYSQRELARRAGIASNSVAVTERGEHAPTFPTIQKLARALDVGPGELFKEPVPLGEAPPPLVLAAMYREEDENVRRRALEAASEDEIERYVNSINEQVEWAEKTQRSPEGQGAGNRQGLRLYIHHLLTLRDEAKPGDTPPSFEEMAALAHAGAES